MNKLNITTDVKAEALKRKKNKSGHIAYLMNKLFIDREAAIELFRSFDDIKDSNIVVAKGYTFNKAADKYIVPLTSYGKNYVCPGEQHRAMLAAYSNWKGDEQSLTKIAHTYKMQRAWVIEYFKIMGWTHDSLPISNEEILADKCNDAINRVLATKKTVLQQELQQADWKQTQADAEKWALFEAGKLDPFLQALERFTPRALPITPYKGQPTTNDEILLIGLSDLHFGSHASSEELFSGNDFNSEIISNIMVSYFNQIKNEITNRNGAFKEVVVASLGDILHGLSGYTVKGTPLESDVLREEQFELALNSIITFLTGLLTLTKKVSVYAVKGNHAGVGDYILFKTIETYFRNDNRISFNLFKSRQGCFKIGNTAILIDHGASDFAKSIMPGSGAPKEAYVQGLFMEYRELLTNTKIKLILNGDSHRFLHEEMRGFEHVVFGSCVSGDRYSDNLGLHSRPRQNCLILSKDGLKETISFYFD